MNFSASQESGLKPDRGWRTLLMVSFHLVCWEGPCWKVPCAGRGTLRSFSCCCIWSSSKWRWTSRDTTSPTATRKTSSWLEIRKTRNFSFWRWWCSQLHCPLLIISFKISNLTLASYLNRICSVCRVGIHKTSMFLMNTVQIQNFILVCFLVFVQVPGVSENRPSVLRGDSLLVYPVGERGVKYRGYVHSVQLDSVKLGFGPK